MSELPRRPSPSPRDDDPVLPDVTSDERPDRGDPREDDRRSREWYERERPPHHE